MNDTSDTNFKASAVGTEQPIDPSELEHERTMRDIRRDNEQCKSVAYKKAVTRRTEISKIMGYIFVPYIFILIGIVVGCVVYPSRFYMSTGEHVFAISLLLIIAKLSNQSNDTGGLVDIIRSFRDKRD